jgi:hypothetical protein
MATQPLHTIWPERLTDGRVIYMARCEQSRGVMSDGTSPMEAIYHLGMAHQLVEDHLAEHGVPGLSCDGAMIVVLSSEPADLSEVQSE